MEKKYCPKCGAKLSKTARCCIECGEFLEELPKQEPTTPATHSEPTAPVKQAEPLEKADIMFVENPNDNYIAPEDHDDKKDPVEDIFNDTPKKNPKKMGTVTLMWLQLLYAIPVVGLITAIILLAAKKGNTTVRLLSKARIGWAIVSLILIVAFITVYELWLRTYLISEGILGLAIGDLKIYFEELTLTRFF